MSHFAIVEVEPCLWNRADHTQTPEDCDWAGTPVGPSYCDGCLRNGLRAIPSTAKPVRPIQGGGCRGDEWVELSRWPRG